MSSKSPEKPHLRIVDIRDTVIFDPERGSRRVYEVRYELPNKNVRSVFIPVEEYTPDEALRRVREDYEKFGKLLGMEL
jgi:hypothetical protein